MTRFMNDIKYEESSPQNILRTFHKIQRIFVKNKTKQILIDFLILFFIKKSQHFYHGSLAAVKLKHFN